MTILLNQTKTRKMRINAQLRKKEELRQGVSRTGSNYKAQVIIIAMPERDAMGQVMGDANGNTIESRISVTALNEVTDKLAPFAEGQWVTVDVRFSLRTNNNYVVQDCRLIDIQPMTANY